MRSGTRRRVPIRDTSLGIGIGLEWTWRQTFKSVGTGAGFSRGDFMYGLVNNSIEQPVVHRFGEVDRNGDSDFRGFLTRYEAH